MFTNAAMVIKRFNSCSLISNLISSWTMNILFSLAFNLKMFGTKKGCLIANWLYQYGNKKW